jgi:gluconate 2-dehydrogenase gamma chain
MHEEKTSESVRALSTVESETLAAIADRIFPKTDTPGGVEIGAVDYIEVALTGDYAALAPLYREGLRAVEREAHRRAGARFAELTGQQQDEILGEFETGKIEKFKKAAEFFDVVRYHVLEGIFCEPQYGGNKDMLGWRLVNFPGQQSGYADAYINKSVDIEPIAVDRGKKPEK